ncbi:2000_t:CDS:2 [Ambispora leptoticha]|uniref:Chitin synthase export chaperone n=1 Tax=Ambispora leptoticha TaxID=144679 RepID=A0A9N9HSI8_9GLOM|nr:2000_t:CDS:2 [Ambispora leptoticha]
MSFGDFNRICETVALTVCPLVGAPQGIEPTCYSRNFDVAGTLIFQPATIIIHVIALIMTTIMIYHIKSKYTAVGRKEIVMFFYMYMILTFLELLLVSGIIPTASTLYPYFTAAHVGLITATFWCLLLNGFVGFQLTEDGTSTSLWSIRLSSLFVFAAVFFLATATFKGMAAFNPLRPVALWIVLYVFNGAALAIYIACQIVLVLNTLDDRWPLGDIAFGISFYVVGQLILYMFSVKICDTAKHYIDGLFFGTICTLLAVMMVYKYWDSITKEDLEFSVGSKQNVWEVKDIGEDDGYSKQQQQQNYGGY